MKYERLKHKKYGARSAKRVHGIGPEAFKGIRKLEDKSVRNILRGLLSQRHDKTPPYETINNIRSTSSPKDLSKAAEVILGNKGAFPQSVLGSTYRTLLMRHGLNTIPPQAEAAFVAGHLNGWEQETCAIIKAMGEFSNLPNVPAGDAMSAVAVFVDRYGASNYIARKIAYIMADNSNDPLVQEPFRAISLKVEHGKRAHPYFMSLELIDDEFPYFSGVSTRIQVYSKYIESDYRNIYALNELVPVPLDDIDAAAQLRKAHTTSLVDEIATVLVIIQLERRWPNLAAEFKKRHSQNIQDQIDRFRDVSFDAKALYAGVPPKRADFVFYRRCLAFVEFSECAKYRIFVNEVLAPRLIPSLPKIDLSNKYQPKIRPKDLTKALNGFRKLKDYNQIQNCGVFLRTVQFISYVASDNSLAMAETDLRNILNKTISLELLLLDDEIEQMYSSNEGEAKPLVTLLALALHKAKNHDEDIDFKFRFALSEIVLQQFHGSIEKFIEWLLPSTSEIANYLLFILDRPTLQKLYWIVKTVDEADVARQALLRAVGKQRNAIQYFVEADAIEARRQVAKLQKYFDDSRVYVDGIALKSWLISNPSAYAQQYLKIVEHSFDLVSATTVLIENGAVVSAGTTDMSTLSSFDYMLLEAAKIAFTQFCESKEFGIESYLGRRIRHNTLTGMMRSGVEDAIDLPQFYALIVDKNFRAANKAWIDAYRAFIEELRRDFLQFKSDSRPKGMFSSSMKDDENTRSNVAAIRNIMLKHRNPELFNELLIRICWQEIDPQLREITTFVTVDALKHAHNLVESAIGEFDSDLCRQYRTHVRDALHERFTRLGSWFRQPEDGFVVCSTRQLAELILLEAAGGELMDNSKIIFEGNGLDEMMDGLSVHRMYDCLFILLRNALKYGNSSNPILINVASIKHASEQIFKNQVAVTSMFESEVEKSRHLKRIEESFATNELSAAMVIDHYSGLRKLRYITQSSEGISTAWFRVEAESCTVGFTLTVELAKLGLVSDESLIN